MARILGSDFLNQIQNQTLKEEKLTSTEGQFVISIWQIPSPPFFYQLGNERPFAASSQVHIGLVGYIFLVFYWPRLDKKA